MREHLPIIAFEEKIIRAVQENQVVVIAAETGAGKSTEVPRMLRRAGFGKREQIGITQPRRVAAMSVAGYVAELEGVALGTVIGYHIRNEKKISDATRVKFMTEGILLRELHSDPSLKRYEIVIIDEAHERGVNQDLLLALLKKLRKTRPDMKIIIMSATIDEERFAAHFDDAPIVKVPGRVFEVETRWASETPYGTKQIVEIAATTVTDRIIGNREKGDILVFMPDEQSIKQTCAALEEKLGDTARILPLYGSQAPEDQRKIFERNGKRRVIVATNIAETSITIDGVVHVVDSGLIKAVQYVNASMSALQIMEHSKAGCRQRKGRAGRTQAGVYWPIFDQDNFEERPDYTEPELKRMTLDQILLHLRTLDYSTDEVMNLDFMDPPGDTRWREAEARLKILGALDGNGEVTEDGRRMERLPVAPMLGRMILASQRYGVVTEIAAIVSALAARQVFVRPKDKEKEADASHRTFKDTISDALTLLAVWSAWGRAGKNGKKSGWARDRFLSSRALGEIERNRDQILRILETEGIALSSSNDPVAIRKAVAAGLIVNLCVKQGRFDYAWQDQTVFIHPRSGLFGTNPQMMVCSTVVATTKPYARDCTAIDPAWIEELIPESARTRGWEIREGYGFFGRQEPAQVIERVTWQGTQLREEVITHFPAEAIPFFATRLAHETLDGLRSPIHPQTPVNRKAWKIIERAVAGKGILALTFLGNFEKLEGEFKEIVDRLVAFFSERIKGATSLEEVAHRDINLKLEDWISPELLATHAAELEREQAREEERERLQKERTAPYANEEQTRRTERSGEEEKILAKIGVLETRLIPLSGPIAVGLRGQLALLRRRLDWNTSNYVSEKVNNLELPVAKLEREHSEGIELGRQVWEEVRTQFPACPLCDSTWQERDREFVCQQEHDLRRVVPIESSTTSPHEIVRFTTDRDELVAELQTTDDWDVLIRFTVPRAKAWTGKKFKSVSMKPHAVIMPPELVAERDSIVRDLAELREAREELEAVSARIREAEKKVGAGAMKLLTFRVVNGEAVAEDTGITYRAAYAELYPANGERWFCRIGRDISLAGTRTREIYAEFKASSIASAADLESIRSYLREAYPGLPDELLFVQ